MSSVDVKSPVPKVMYRRRRHSTFQLKNVFKNGAASLNDDESVELVVDEFSQLVPKEEKKSENRL